MANYEIHQNVYQPIKVNCEVTKWMYHLIQTNLTEKQLEKLKQEYEAQELSKEEINVYAAGCGEIQNHCKNDCFGGGSFLNPDY